MEIYHCFMEIHLTKSTLRPWRIDDVPSLAFHANNVKIAENLTDAFPSPYKLEHAMHYINHVCSDANNLIFAIEINNEAVGSIGIHCQTDVYRRSAKFGYWLSEKYWGQGIVTEAANATVKYGFDHLNIHRIQAGIFEINPASMRVLVKCGFSLEAIHRKAIIKNERVMDEYLYVRINTTEA